MNKNLFPVVLSGLLISACLPAFLQPAASNASPVPVSDSDLEGTASVLSQLTLQALPTPTIAPSETPVITTPTVSGTPPGTPSDNGTPAAEVATAITDTALSTAALSIATSLISPTSPTNTRDPALSPTLTETLHPRFYGTLPPNLPSGKIVLVNRSKKEVYISLQCTTKDGYISILEYPVPQKLETRAPAGKYLYVAWVGGNKLSGKFSLGAQDEITITINKDGISIR